MGRFNHSKRFISQMVECMYDECMHRIKTWLHATDEITGKRRVFALTADKVTEQHRTGQAVGLHAFDQGEIKAVFVDYNLAKDGTGKGLAADLIELTLGEKLGIQGKSQLLEQMVGLAADGAYFTLNTMENVAGYFLDEGGDAEKMLHWLLPTWDGAHRLELTLGDVRQDKEGVGVALKSVPWYIDLSTSISNIYNKFAYGKGYEILHDIAEDESVRLYALKYFCDTRFAQSERTVFLNFLRNFKVLHVAVRGRSTDPKLSAADREEAKTWLDSCLENYDFMGKMLLITALLEQCMFLSLQMQTVNALPWELMEQQHNFAHLMRKSSEVLRAHQDFDKECFPFLHKVCCPCSNPETAICM